MNKENRKIVLKGREVAYCLKTSRRARRLRIVIKPGGAVDAVVPHFADEKAAQNFLTKKAGWVLDKISELKDKKNLLPRGGCREFMKYRFAARDLVLQKIAKINLIYNFKYGRVAIRDQKTRWGSCSAKGNLNFNYRVALLPDHLAGYIVAHELCHLKELNHSPCFWNLLAVAFPDWKNLRRELAKNYILS